MLPEQPAQRLRAVLNATKQLACGRLTDRLISDLLGREASVQALHRVRTAAGPWRDEHLADQVVTVCSQVLGVTRTELWDVVTGRARCLPRSPFLNDVVWASEVWMPRGRRDADRFDATLRRHERAAVQKLTWRRLPPARFMTERARVNLVRRAVEGLGGSEGSVRDAVGRLLRRRAAASGCGPHPTVVMLRSDFEAVLDRRQSNDWLAEDDVRELAENTLAAVDGGELTMYFVEGGPDEVRRISAPFRRYSVVSMLDDRVILKRPQNAVHRTLHERAADGSNTWFFQWHHDVFRGLRPALVPSRDLVLEMYQARWGPPPSADSGGRTHRAPWRCRSRKLRGPGTLVRPPGSTAVPGGG